MAIVSKQRKRDPKIQWFDEARFGMFVHFGLHALLGRGEWVMYHEEIPRREYERLTARFNPSRFDADAWVDLALRAGARYITVTAKHHDGFCLFDSQHTDFKITNTPFGRDLIGELIRACHRKRMRIILYYSQPDWHHPNYLHKKGAFKDLQRPPATDRPDWPQYQRYLEAQVLELVTRYGRIDGIWFDGSHKSERDWRGKRLYRLIKRHQPGAVVNDRARYGDFFTPERSLPEDLTGYLFEACESVLTTSWGHKPGSPLHNVPHLIESLARMSAAGGNYLLNVGPKPDGSIPRDQTLRMERIGAWLRRNGEAVYGTRECRIVTGSPGILATRTDRNVYLLLLRWPTEDRLCVAGVRSKPASAQLIGADRPLGVRATENGLELSDLPASPVEDSANVIRLRFGSSPRLEVPRAARVPLEAVSLRADGVNRLAAADARLHGYRVKGSRLSLRTPEGGSPCIAGWGALEQFATWRVRSPARRRYRVSVRFACPDPYAGSQFVIEAGGDSVRGEVQGTASFDAFRLHEVGALTLPRGESQIRLRPLYLPYGYIFADVEGIELRAAKRAPQRRTSPPRA